MASGTTDRGKKLLLDYAFEASTVPTTYYLALATSAATPSKVSNLWSEMTEIATGNGYTSGGSALTAATNFTVTEVDGASVGAKVIADDVTWTASGGNIPASGSGARWALLLDGNISTSNILSYFDLVSDRTVSDTQTLTIQAAEIDANEP